jgi:hypothetical protein
MSTAAMHAHAFYREVAMSRALWGIRDSEGFPGPAGSDGRRAMPFWSSERRARTVIRQVDAYRDFVPVKIDWESFCNRWLPGLIRDDLRAGLNWSGPKATGYDVDPKDLKANVEAAPLALDGRR